MDPELQKLITLEIKALQAQQDEIFNSDYSEEMKKTETASINSWGQMLVGIMEWLPSLKAHLKQKHGGKV